MNPGLEYSTLLIRLQFEPEEDFYLFIYLFKDLYKAVTEQKQ